MTMTEMVAGISKAAVEREAAMMEASHNFIWARKLRALRAALDKAEADNARLRADMRHIVTYVAEPSDLDGDTINALRADLRFVGHIARVALTGKADQAVAGAALDCVCGMGFGPCKDPKCKAPILKKKGDSDE
jgi:hypothetical protein